MADGVLSRVPGLAGFLSGEDRNQQQESVNLQQLGLVQGILSKARAEQQDMALRGELAAADTSEKKAAVAMKYGGPTAIMSHLDRQSGQEATKQTALARLQQAAAQNDSMMQFRVAQAKTQGERDAALQAHRQLSDQIAAERLKYDTGATVAVPPLPAAAPPQGQWTPAEGVDFNLGGIKGSAPDQASVMALAKLLGIGGPQAAAAAPAPPVAAPVQPAAMPAAPNNLDARDLGAGSRGPVMGSTPTAPVAPVAPLTPQPTAPVPAAPAATAAPVMPPQIAALPKKQQDAWVVQQAKAAPTAGQLGPEELGPMAWEKLLFGTNPPGMGNASAAQRQQVNQERARLGRSLGLSDMEMAMLPQDNKVKMKAVDTLTKWGATVGRSAEKLDLDLGVALDYAKRLPLGQVQIINKGILAGNKEFNNPDANAYATAINSVRQEYARLMSGPTSNAMLPVEAMKKGNELLSTGVDVASLEEVGKQMRRDAANTMTATKNGIDALRGSITSLGKTSAFDRSNGGSIPEFATEADARKAGVKDGTRVKIGGREGKWVE